MVFSNGQFSSDSSYQDAALSSFQQAPGGQPAGDFPAMTQAQIPQAVGFQPSAPQPSTLDKILPWVQAVGALAQGGAAAYGAVSGGGGGGGVEAAQSPDSGGIGAGASQGFSGEGSFGSAPEYARAPGSGPLELGDGGRGGSPGTMGTYPAEPGGAVEPVLGQQNNSIGAGGSVAGINRVATQLPSNQVEEDAVGVRRGEGFWDTYASGATQGSKFGPLGTVIGAVYGAAAGLYDMF